jgi:hypothetical protein
LHRRDAPVEIAGRFELAPAARLGAVAVVTAFVPRDGGNLLIAITSVSDGTVARDQEKVARSDGRGGRMKLLALVTDSSSVARYLRAFGAYIAFREHSFRDAMNAPFAPMNTSEIDTNADFA